MNIKTISPSILEKPTLYWFLGASTSQDAQDFAAFSSILEYIQSREELAFPYNITLIKTTAAKNEIKAHAKLVKEGDAVFTACAGSVNTECFLDELHQTTPDKLKTIKHVMFHHYSQALFGKYPERFKIAFLPKHRDNSILESQLKPGKALASAVSTLVFDDSTLLLGSSNRINPRVPYLLQPKCIPATNTTAVHEQNNVILTDTNKMAHSVQKIITDPEGRCLFQYSLINALLQSLVKSTTEASFITLLSQSLKDHAMHSAECFVRTNPEKLLTSGETTHKKRENFVPRAIGYLSQRSVEETGPEVKIKQLNIALETEKNNDTPIDVRQHPKKGEDFVLREIKRLSQVIVGKAGAEAKIGQLKMALDVAKKDDTCIDVRQHPNIIGALNIRRRTWDFFHPVPQSAINLHDDLKIKPVM